MASIAAHLDVHCPDCAESFTVSIEVIEASQRMLEECGYCTGLASFECPAPYFAALAGPEVLARAHARLGLPCGPSPTAAELTRWDDDGGARASAG